MTRLVLAALALAACGVNGDEVECRRDYYAAVLVEDGYAVGSWCPSPVEFIRDGRCVYRDTLCGDVVKVWGCWDRETGDYCEHWNGEAFGDPADANVTKTEAIK